MLPRIVLVALQFILPWFVAGWIAPSILLGLGLGTELTLIAYAIIYAVLVWIVGLAGSSVLKGLIGPSFATFAATLVGALLLALLLIVEPIRDAIGSIISFRQIPQVYFPLVGAIIGYALKR